MARRAKKKDIYRSGFEHKISEYLKEKGINFEYESMTIKWVFPEQHKKYKPDFIIKTATGKQIIIEAKGYFKPADRLKMLYVKEQHPDLDIRMLFQTANNKIGKKTYGEWCDKYGIKWAEKQVPEKWYQE